MSWEVLFVAQHALLKDKARFASHFKVVRQPHLKLTFLKYDNTSIISSHLNTLHPLDNLQLEFKVDIFNTGQYPLSSLKIHSTNWKPSTWIISRSCWHYMCHCKLLKIWCARTHKHLSRAVWIIKLRQTGEMSTWSSSLCYCLCN